MTYSDGYGGGSNIPRGNQSGDDVTVDYMHGVMIESLFGRLGGC